jgi:hypothetical protein
MCRSQQDAGNLTLIYNGDEINIFRIGFMINRKYKQAIMNLEAVDDRICSLRIRGKFNNLTVISVPAHTEEKDELIRTAFTINLIRYIKAFQHMILKLWKRFCC